MASPVRLRGLVLRRVALPQQHGSWALWLGPYAIGIGVGANLTSGLLWLTAAAAGGFLALQPLTILVKIHSGRRAGTEWTPALFWLGCWTLLSVVGCIGLLYTGNGRILWLGWVALPVLAWQMRLVARREDRGQMGAEIAGTGVLTLAAPAAYWSTAGAGGAAWWLWILCWLQASGAVMYIYARLEYRRLRHNPSWPERLRTARRSVLYNGAGLFIVAALALLDFVPRAVIVAFAAMFAESIYGGLLSPCVAARPAAIGLRQVLATVVFSALMIWGYH